MSYFVTILDDFSRVVWMYLLVEKSAVPSTIKEFFSMVKTQFLKNIKIMQNDNVTKFTYLKPYFLEHSVFHQTTIAGTPQQKG